MKSPGGGSGCTTDIGLCWEASPDGRLFHPRSTSNFNFQYYKGSKKMSTETQSTHSSSLLLAPAFSKNRGQILVGITTQRFGLLPEKKWSFC